MNEQPIPLWRKIEILFETLTTAQGHPYTLTELAEHTGMALNTISRLKTGRIEDPRFSTLLLIADFFGIALDYFACRSEKDCLNFLQQEVLRRSTVPEIAMRVRSMSDEVMQEVQRMLAYVETLQSSQGASYVDHPPTPIDQ